MYTRVFSGLAGPVTLFFIATYLSPAEQGYYYTFFSLAALQLFAELGLGIVLIQFFAHEWAWLKTDDEHVIQGPEKNVSRLSELLRFSVKWYVVAAGVLFCLLTFGGVAFLTTDDAVLPTQKWLHPWSLFCFTTSLHLILLPLLSCLEGCGKVLLVLKFRFHQVVVGTIVGWFAIVCGLGLYAPAMSSLATLLLAGLTFVRKEWSFLRQIWEWPSQSGSVNWWLEIMPVQWRIAVSVVSGFFVFSLVVPISFKFFGPEVAGKLGMSFAIITMIGNLSFAWLTPKAQKFGILVSQGAYRELDMLFFRLLGITFGVMVSLAIGFIVFLYVLEMIAPDLAGRVLSIELVSIFLCSYVVGYASVPFNQYMRAHKQEPAFLAIAICSVLIAVSVIVTARLNDMWLMAWLYLLSNLLLSGAVISIWRVKRTSWQTLRTNVD